MASFLDGIIQGSVVWNKTLEQVQKTFSVFFKIADVLLVGGCGYLIWTTTINPIALVLGTVVLIFLFWGLNTFIGISCSALLVRYNISMSTESLRTLQSDTLILEGMKFRDATPEEMQGLYKSLETEQGKFIGRKLLLERGLLVGE